MDENELVNITLTAPRNVVSWKEYGMQMYTNLLYCCVIFLHTFFDVNTRLDPLRIFSPKASSLIKKSIEYTITELQKSSRSCLHLGIKLKTGRREGSDKGTGNTGDWGRKKEAFSVSERLLDS